MLGSDDAALLVAGQGGDENEDGKNTDGEGSPGFNTGVSVRILYCLHVMLRSLRRFILHTSCCSHYSSCKQLN